MSAGIGWALVTLRESAGWSLDEAAKALGVGATYLAAVEAGTKNATPAWIGNVSTAYATRLKALGEVSSV